LDDNLIAVLPFTVRTSDSSYNYLREGLIDLVGARLTGDALPRIVDTRAIMSAYKREIARAGEDLSVEQSVQLARRLGAGRLLVGELVVTHGGVSVSARLIQVASGRVLTSHSESGTGSELALFLRFTDVLFAKSLGERTSRLSALSDRPEAIKAYLAGMQEQRAYHPLRAYNFFDQALQSDPNFAPAALWRAYAAWGAFTFGTSEKRRADSAAWAHRARFSRRDSLLLAALPSIGPNYPNPSTAIELLQAQERAARANPDRPEVWADWSTHLRAWGQQAGLARPLELAAFAADSAIALDSNFVPALSQRYYVALLQHDSSGVRRYGQLLDQAGHSEKGNPSLRWAGARLLGDSAHLEEWFARMVELSRPPFNVEIWSAYYGLASVEDAERFTRVRLARSDTTAASERQALWRTLFRIAILRGEHRRALALVDSAEFVEGVIHLSLAENAYDADAARAVRVLEARIDTTSNQQMRANGLCEIQMWRASRRDTLRTRAAMAEMRVIINTIDAAPGWRVGRLGLCPLLLDAILENGAGDAGGRNALRDLQTLLRKGTLTESPGNVAYLIAARQLEAQGQPGLALELIRRRDPMAWQIIHPASWRLEGRLASKVGDKAGAIHAYRRFLEIRDKADPGPVADEVIAVRKELQHLVSATKTQ
jgi:TolB-like protein